MKKAKKSLGQNFLTDKNVAKKIINQIPIRNKIILEVGPGYGFLTDFILEEKPKNLILVEKDKNIYYFLKDKYLNHKNIKIFNQDILKFNFKNYRKINIISNLPYNISSQIILKLLKLPKNINEMLIMIQKEMSEKFDYNRKTINKYKFFFKISSTYKSLFDVPKTVFSPKPKVTSTVVKINLKNEIINWNKVEMFANTIFRNKRKKISNKIKSKDMKIDIYLDKRVDQLDIFDLLKIYNSF